MFNPILAADLLQLVDKFGLHTEAFVAHLIAFFILVAVIVTFGIKPIAQQLEERRRRIEEGEAMHARSVQELAEVKSTGEQLLSEAREQGRREVEHARSTAARLQEELSAKASAEAQTLLDKARRQAETDSRREKEALRGEFARLVALSTAQVTGKVLTEEDHRRINDEAIRNL